MIMLCTYYNGAEDSQLIKKKKKMLTNIILRTENFFFKNLTGLIEIIFYTLYFISTISKCVYNDYA